MSVSSIILIVNLTLKLLKKSVEVASRRKTSITLNAGLTWLSVSARLWIASENMEWDPVTAQAPSLAAKLPVLMAIAARTTLPESPAEIAEVMRSQFEVVVNE